MLSDLVRLDRRHMQHVLLYGMKSNTCPQCQVPTEDLETLSVRYRARNYIRYDSYQQENKTHRTKIEHCQDTLDALDIKIGHNVFHKLPQVSALDLHKPHMIHTDYLDLFTHMKDWITGFPKKHVRQEVFDDAWKALPLYPGFYVPKKAYREVTQWQGKEIRNLGHCLLGVLTMAIRWPDSTHVQPCRDELTCLRSLVDFSMRAQYRSPTSETIDYMQEYMTRFHETKDIFLEFLVSKQTRAKADELRRELRQYQNQVKQLVPQSKRCWVRDEDGEDMNDQHMELIYAESNFNFIKIHLSTYFHDHIYKFSNILMYSTEFGELAHKEQIKDGW